MRTVDPEANESRRRAILDAAARCFAAAGFRATRTAEICAAAGMSAGNMFHYFPTKHAVLCALVEREGEQADVWLEELRSAADPFLALTAFLATICELAADPMVAGLALESSAIAHRDEVVAELLRANDAALRDGVADLVARARDAGQISAPMSAESAATWIAALVDGVFARRAVQPEFRPADEAQALLTIVSRVLGRTETR
ncbi:TetR/AcrR family transcriptional regulator [Antrihabitans spumae]|uniref:TetR/AcrR family transcriptional regulator n=1 Tax=Antrihabitans spumae TaxID=3373370 RepID=A0ABW7KBJ0_9NOCA